MKGRRFLLLGAMLLAGFGLGLIIFVGLPSLNNADPVVVGKRAPDFSLQTPAGETVRLEDFRGQAVAVNFWATWCPPCRAEMPLLQQTSDQYQGKLVVLGVNLDESAALVTRFAVDQKIGFPLLLDPGSVLSERYQVSGYPTTIFIDADGIVRGRHTGQLLPNALDFYLRAVGVLN